MAEPLKNLYSKPFITNLGSEISQHYPNFDKKAFSQSIFDKNWKHKELKQRMRHITVCLHQYLPADYKKAIAILIPTSEKFTGFEPMIFQDYVECYGLKDYQTSIPALEHFTKFSSSEFAVRAFILQDEKRMMKQMLDWAKSENHHVRRQASEGTRPRLPWAIALPAFKKYPKPVLRILKTLMYDDSEYVRRSAANNLNDISKDNPDIVLDWAEYWLKRNRSVKNAELNKKTNQLIKHACRTLLKQGNSKALLLFGFLQTEHIEISQFKVQPSVTLGEKLQFSFLLKSQQSQLGKCRIEFSISFVKANGKHTRKVFKISEFDYDENEKQVTKYFSFKKIKTRKYYSGKHKLAIIINGVEQTAKPFDLIV